MHRSLKQYFGVGDCYSGKFLLYLCYLKALDIEKTIESLWKDYILKKNARYSLRVKYKLV